ncbi:MAG: RNA polymerase sigma factor region1.1 domain-containing protein [Planctomycetota bacterium]
MAKKEKKPDKQNTPPKSANSDESSASAKTKDAEKQIKTLIEKGGKKGFLTYEEMNKQLPEEAVSPARLDSLLATLDEMGINLVDEADVEKQAGEGFGVSEEPEEAVSGEEAARVEQLKEDRMLEKQLTGTEVLREGLTILSECI